MSKFANHMHLLNLNEKEIRERKFPDDLRPFHKQEVCVIPLDLPEINPECANCKFRHIVTTQGKVDELGAKGWMTNQPGGEKDGVKYPDGLKPDKINPVMGVSLRNPRTIIIAEGQSHACKHRLQKDIFLLNDREPGCTIHRPEFDIVPEKKNKKTEE